MVLLKEIEDKNRFVPLKFLTEERFRYIMEHNPKLVQNILGYLAKKEKYSFQNIYNKVIVEHNASINYDAEVVIFSHFNCLHTVFLDDYGVWKKDERNTNAVILDEKSTLMYQNALYYEYGRPYAKALMDYNENIKNQQVLKLQDSEKESNKRKSDIIRLMYSNGAFNPSIETPNDFSQEIIPSSLTKK